MKLRVKHRNSTSTLDLGDAKPSDILLSSLRQIILNSDRRNNPECQLSMNNKDPLEGDDKPLSDFGIVSGDSIFILSQQEEVQLNPPAAAAVNEDAFDAPHGAMDLNTNQNSNETDNEVPQCSGEQSHPSITGVSAPNLPSSSGASMPGGAEGIVPMEVEPEKVVDAAVLRCLSEPQLCRESTSNAIPARLQHLLESARCLNAKDALYVVLCVLMREAGFEMPTSEGTPNEVQDVRLGVNWNKGPFYKMQFVHPMAEGKTCHLIAMPLPASVMVYGSLGDPSFKTGCLQIQPGDYIRDFSSVTASCVKNLEKLSLIFKDAVCSPLLQEMQSALGLPPQNGILSLPHELKLRLLGFLPAESIATLGQTCKAFQAVYKDNTAWRRRYLLDFGRRDDMSLGQNWYQIYRQDYSARAERRKLMRIYFEQALPPMPHHSNPYTSYIPPFAGFLGGDYDLDPDFTGGLGGPFGPHLGQGFVPRPRLELPTPPRPRPPFFDRPPHGGNAPNPFGGGGGGFGFSPRFI